MLTLSLSSESQIRNRRGLSLLYEAVQKYHTSVLIDVEQDPRNTIALKVGPHLIEPTAQRATSRHAYRPSVFDGLDILTNSLAILRVRQTLEPFPNRLASSFCPEEDRRSPLALATHNEEPELAPALLFLSPTNKCTI